jgi:hypothetical protein
MTAQAGPLVGAGNRNRRPMAAMPGGQVNRAQERAGGNARVLAIQHTWEPLAAEEDDALTGSKADCRTGWQAAGPRRPEAA